MTNRVVTRMWINQPSIYNPFHKYHGENVLAHGDTDDTCRIYFLDGPIISMQIPSNCLSKGWLPSNTGYSDNKQKYNISLDD